MNRGEIRTEVRDILGEDDPGDFWSNTELNRYIDEAQFRFAKERRWSWLLTEGSATLVAGDSELELTEGVGAYRHLNVLLTKTGDTRPYLPERVTPTRGFELRTVYYTPQSYPTWFYVARVSDDDDNGQPTTVMHFIPEPTEDVDVVWQHYRIPSSLAGDSTNPEMPEELHKALVHFAAGTAWLKELNGGSKSSEQFQLYAKVLEQAVLDEASDADDRPLVSGGNTPVTTRGGRSQMSARDYALLRIAPTLGS